MCFFYGFNITLSPKSVEMPKCECSPKPSQLAKCQMLFVIGGQTFLSRQRLSGKHLFM